MNLFNDCRIEWRMSDVERKADQAVSRLYEIDAINSNVGSVERSIREICACVDGLRNEIQAHLCRIEQLENKAVETVGLFENNPLEWMDKYMAKKS